MQLIHLDYKKMTQKKVIQELKKDMYHLKPNSYSIIISGEGYYKIWNEVREDVIRAIEKKNCHLEFIAGPVLSCDRHGNNPLIDFAKYKNNVNLYFSSYRQKKHERVMGLKLVNNTYLPSQNTKIYSELYHMPLEKDRRSLAITRKNRNFEDLLEATISKHRDIMKYEALKKTDSINDFLPLSLDKINRLRRACLKRDLDIDLLNKKSLIAILKEEKINFN